MCDGGAGRLPETAAAMLLQCCYLFCLRVKQRRQFPTISHKAKTWGGADPSFPPFVVCNYQYM